MRLSEAHLHGGVWSFMSGFEINRAGFAIAIAWWRIGDLEQRWVPTSPPTGDLGPCRPEREPPSIET